MKSRVYNKLNDKVLSHPDIEAIATKYGKSTANVVLRWHLQMEGTMVCKVGKIHHYRPFWTTPLLQNGLCGLIMITNKLRYFYKIVFQSVTPSRIEENFKIWDFSLSAEDMAVFDKMNVGWRHLLWAETSMHPDYPFKVATHIVIYVHSFLI